MIRRRTVTFTCLEFYSRIFTFTTQASEKLKQETWVFLKSWDELGPLAVLKHLLDVLGLHDNLSHVEPAQYTLRTAVISYDLAVDRIAGVLCPHVSQGMIRLFAKTTYYSLSSHILLSSP